MALVLFEVAVLDHVNNPNNTLAATAIQIRTTGVGTPLASIFSDEAGLNPITQPGAVTDSFGVFSFYADVDLASYTANYTASGSPRITALDSGDHSKLTNRGAVGAHDAGAITSAVRAYGTVVSMVSNASGIAYVVGQALKVQGENGEFINYIVAVSGDLNKGDVNLGGGLWAVNTRLGNIGDRDYSTISSNTTVQAVIDASTHASKIKIQGKAGYDNDVDWKGREHEAADLPFLLNSVAQAGGNLSAGMTVSNGQLYVTNFIDNTVNVYGLSDPRKPQIAFSFGVGSNPRWVEVLGRIVIVACNLSATLEFYDIASPQSVTKIGEISTGVGSRPKQFVVDGDLIYLLCSTVNEIQKYRFTLPFEGIPLRIELLKTATTSTEPLHLSLNGDGIIAVGGFATANIDLYGADNLNLIHTSAIGGIEHSSCEWINKSLLAVLDATNNTLIMVSYGVLTAPNIRSTTATVDNPSQIEIVGNRLYTMSLTGAAVQAKFAAFDITNAEFPTEYKQVDLSVEGAGFSSYHQVGNTGYVYVNGHTAPFNIDVVEVVAGDAHERYEDKPLNAMLLDVSIASANIGLNRVEQSHNEALVNITTSSQTNVALLGLGIAVTLHDPDTDHSHEMTLLNASGVDTSVVNNAFAGFSGTIGIDSSITLVSLDFGGVFQWYVKSSHGTIT